MRFQTDCKGEIDASAEFFGVSDVDPSNLEALSAADLAVSEAQINAFIKAQGRASPKCCRAACKYNSDGCNCEPGARVTEC